MIEIRRKGLASLANFHYNEYFLKDGFNEKLSELIAQEQQPFKKEFYKDIQEYCYDIITGEPENLRSIINVFFQKHKYIMDALVKNKKHKTHNSYEARKAANRITTLKKKMAACGDEEIIQLWGKYKGEKKYLDHLEDTINILTESITLSEIIREELDQVFNYNHFSNNDGDGLWGGYALTRSLQINVCPYCNRNFTNTYEEDGAGKTRPQLDHYYPKSLYPFFAVSFFNLVPCCAVCNSSFKGAVDFYSKIHIHPYEMGFNDFCKFSVEFKEGHEHDYVSFWYKPQSDVFNLRLKISPVIADEKIIESLRNNIETFQLDGIYDSFHKDYVSELIITAREYNGEAIDMIMSAFKHLFTKREDAIRFISRNYVTLDDLEKRPLAKLNRDILQQFKLI